MVNWQLTQLETALISLACLLGAILASGCATDNYLYKRSVIKPIEVVICSPDMIKYFANVCGCKVKNPYGFYDYKNRTIYCVSTADGLPRFETLGHELWHEESLGGLHWHD